MQTHANKPAAPTALHAHQRVLQCVSARALWPCRSCAPCWPARWSSEHAQGKSLNLSLSLSLSISHIHTHTHNFSLSLSPHLRVEFVCRFIQHPHLLLGSKRRVRVGHCSGGSAYGWQKDVNFIVVCVCVFVCICIFEKKDQ